MTAHPRSPISNSACRICSNAWKPPAITAPAISGGSRTACRTFCAISKTSMPALPRWPRAPATPRRATWCDQDSGLADLVKRELSDIRFSQTERDRHTQDSLEAVHNTLGHVVDRLAMIEGDLRAVRAAPVGAAAEACGPNPDPRAPTRRCRDAAGNPRLPMPAADQAGTAQSCRWRCAFRRRAARIPCRAAVPPAAAASSRRARSAKSWSRMPRRARAAIEPGFAAGSSARAGNAADRTAGVALGAHRGFRKRHQRNSRGQARARHRVELHCRRTPRRPGRRGRAQPTGKAGQAAAKAARFKRRRLPRLPATRNHRPLPPRSARCWSARAWS